MSNFTSTFNSVLDKHASLTALTRKEKRLKKKPWRTPGILASIKTKNKLCEKVFKKKSINSEKEHCKKYLNKFTHIKNVSKKNYYQNLLSNCKSSSKTWSTINEIIDFKNSSNKSKLPHSIVIEDESVKTDSPKFREKLREYFANIGSLMSPNLPFSKSSSKIHHSLCVQSVMLEEILSEDVSDCTDKLNPTLLLALTKFLLNL